MSFLCRLWGVCSVDEGKYRIGEEKRLLLMRVMSNCVMVRVGGGWEDLSKFLERRAAGSGKSKDYKKEARRTVDDILRMTNGKGLCSARTKV